MSMVFYNYFENITDKFYMSVKYDNKIITIRFQYGSYNVSDINQIIDDTIQEKFNITEKPIKLSVDVNRYAILIIVEENWELQLNKNFMNLFGFSNCVITEGYNRSDLIPNIDKVEFLKLYCNLVDNREDDEFLTNVYSIYKLKICKYCFEISKICILSLSTGLSFINAFAIISLIFIPIIDTIKNSSDVDHRLYESKLKKNLLKELLNYKTQTYTELDEEKILELYNKLVYKII